MRTLYLISLFISSQAFAGTSTQLLFVAAPPHFISNPQIQQCAAALPTIGWMGFEHTWINFDGQSFGMPYSFTHNAIQGGYSTIRSPDPSLPNLTSVPICQPAYQPENILPEKFAEKFQCLLSKLTDSDDEIWTDWQPIFIYDWANSNCHSSVRFLTDCAGGAMSLNPNGGLGSHYSPMDLVDVWYKNIHNPVDPKAQNLQNVFQKFLLGLEETIQKHQDLETFFKANNPPLLLEVQNLSKSLEKVRDLAGMGLYRRLQKFTVIFEKLSAQLQVSVSPAALQKMKSLGEIFRQPDTFKKSYQQICEQAQKECL